MKKANGNYIWKMLDQCRYIQWKNITDIKEFDTITEFNKIDINKENKNGKYKNR